MKIKVDPSHEGKRVDIYLSEMLSLSRNTVQKQLKQKEIMVNGKISKPNYKIKSGDFVNIEQKEMKMPEIIPEEMDLDIVYEDESIILVNKPKNMVVHPSNGHDQHTLVHGLMHHCKKSLSGINGILRPGIVHRLDKDTSGLIVVAKNDQAHTNLSIQFSERSVVRKYHFICFNAMKEDSFIINLPIGRNEKDRKKMAITYKNGKEAITHFRVLERLQNYTYGEAALETGRTHQIRVHLKHIGHPLLGDKDYGPKKGDFIHYGQFLHAKTLGFHHPTTGAYVEFETELPSDFNRILHLLRNKG